MKQNKDYQNVISRDGRTLDFSKMPVVVEGSYASWRDSDLSVTDFTIIDFIDSNSNRFDTTKVRHIQSLVPTYERGSNIASIDSITDATLMHIGKKFPQLNSLTVGGSVRITDDGIIGIVGKIGNNLTSLDYSGCKRCTDAALQAIVQNCPNLEHLYANNSGITSIPKTIRRQLPKLKSLHLAVLYVESL